MTNPTTSDGTMWAVLVLGPGTLHACTDLGVADAVALLLNRQFARHGVSELARAEIVEWPHSREEWECASERLRLEVIGAGECAAMKPINQGQTT